MTKHELVEVLDMAIVALESNRRMISSSLLIKVENFIVTYTEHHIVQELLMGVFNLILDDIYNYSDAILKVVRVEKNLLMTPLTDKLIRSIKELKNRPIVLVLLAGLI